MSEFNEDEEFQVPVSPTAQYFNSSVLSVSILCVLEFEIPIQVDDSLTLKLIREVLLPINPRFSSIMVQDKNGVKLWKKVEVIPNNHIHVPIFSEGKSIEFYDECFNEYLSNMALQPLPQSQPLWQIHLIKYPTKNAAGNVVFKLHHALGDGYSLMAALLSCLKRADDPSLPVTLPGVQQNPKGNNCDNNGVFKRVPQILSWTGNTVSDFVWSMLKSTFLKDDRTPIRSGEEGVEFRPMTITTMTFSIDQIKQMKAHLEVSVNDVICGVIFLGTRLYMQAMDPQKTNGIASALVLLNTRAIRGYKSPKKMVEPNSEAAWGNHFAFLHVSVPKLTKKESSNPLNFVLQAQRIITRKRNSAGVYLTGKLLDTLRKHKGSEVWLVNLTQLIYLILRVFVSVSRIERTVGFWSGKGMKQLTKVEFPTSLQATAKFIHKTLNNASMTISNVFGPVEQSALANHPAKGIYFMVAGSPKNLTITILSYMRKLRVAIGTEKGMIDADRFKSSIEEAFSIICNAAVGSSTPAN